MLEITTLPRVAKETAKEGFIPAVYYGAHAKSTPIFINAIDFGKVFASSGESSTITLTTEHGAETALVQDVQLHPVKNYPIHVDFYVVEKGQKLHVKVPLVFVGESPQVKLGNILVKVMHDISVEGDSSSLPSEIEVDISSLAELSDSIHASAIKLPKGVTLHHVEPTDVVASISESVEMVEEAPVAVDLEAIEVEQKGKKEDAAEAEETGTSAE